MGKTTITRVGVLSAGKIFAAVCFLFGIIFAALMAFMSLIFAVLGGAFFGAGAGKSFLLGGGLGLIFMLMWAVFILVFYTVMGFVLGCVYALIYNLVAKYLGGIEIETK